MFYSQFILAKKGPLGTIWIAAHLERKLRKNQIADTDIALSVDSILFPEMPIALRLSSHLLLGVVRIYSKKVNYLFDDCSEALLKVKQAFRSTAVDLPPEKSTAPYHSITMPETFDLDDFELPDSYLQGNYVDQHISSKEQITLQDTMQGVVYSTSKFGLDERFEDDDAYDLDLDEELFVEKAAANPDLATGTSNSNDNPIHASASGILSQELDEYDGNNEPVDYAQAPCTPGLWEEPNLSNVQETSAYDDHQEPENHTVTEFAVKENLESASHHDQFEPHDKSLPHVAATDDMLINDLGVTPFTEAETVIPVSSGPSQEENILNKIFSDVPPGFQIANHNHENFVQYQGNQENEFHCTTELESNIENDTCVSTPQHHASLEPKDSTIPEPNSDFPVLRPCVTFPNHVTNDPVIETEVQVENINSYTNDHPAPVIQNQVQVGNINSYTDDLSAPEKRLSLPHWLSDVPQSFIPETTPIENDITSGKKRTFTEISTTPPDTLNLNKFSSLHTTNTTSQSFNLNQSSGLFSMNTTAQTQSLNLNESSDFYTTAQSLNLNQSSAPFTIDMTGQSVINDDDLLSSILVGRKSSLLKPKATPPVVTPSTKRKRAAPTPKTSAIKRKVLMDDPMVLHGDTIRAQLTNTEDVRRLRKKAPCTRSEISMLQKQFWEDDIFCEPIFTGVSIKLASLHSQLYDLSKIVVSHNDEGEKDPETVSQNVEKDAQMVGGTDVPKEDTHVAQPIEYPMVRDNQTHDISTVNLDYYGNQPPQTVATEPEPFNSEHDLFGERDTMEIDPKTFPDVSVMPTEVEPEHTVVVPFDMSTATGEVQTDAPGVSSSEKIDLQTFDLDINGNKSIESAVASEINIDVRETLEEKQDQDTEFRINEAVVNEDATLASNVNYNTQNSVYNGIFGEEFGTVGAYDTEVNPDHQVTFEMAEMNVEEIPASNRVDDDELSRPAVENNTDFLNFDDDEDEADAGGDYGTDVEATRVIDNSGWSTRTKAVAKYLHVMFDKEGERGRSMIAVNNLLIGKTRKEASRMFFETLVLKTKDYIHVEQGDPFGNINVFPRANLLKSDF